MFGMGWQEILMILVIAVLVIGPEQLPQVARGLGKLMAQFRRATNDLRDHVNREFNQDENFRDFKEFHQSIDSEIRNIGHTAQDYVEKEVAKEEAELTKLEVDMKGAAEDAMQSAKQTAQDVDPATWMQDPDVPTEDSTTKADAGEAATAATQDTEGTTDSSADSSTDDDAPKDSDARKETA